MAPAFPHPRFVHVGRLLAGVALAILALLAVAGPARSDQPLGWNCPDGFEWIRMSGTACVQKRDTLPSNGKIGYDGHALCFDPYVGIYESRPTKDGKPPPGAPYTSFAFLRECLTQKEYEARQARAANGVALGDAGRLLAERGSTLPPGTLVLLGALGSGALVFAAIPLVRRRPLVPGAGSGQPPSAPQPASAQPSADPARLRFDELTRRSAELDRIDGNLARQVARIREQFAANQLSLKDLIQWAGIVADMVGVLPLPQAQIPAALISGGANLAGVALDAVGDPAEVSRQGRALLGDVARLRGIIASERDGIRAELTALSDAAAHPPPTPVAPVDPAVLPDDLLRAERDATQDEVLRLMDASRAATDEWIRMRTMLQEQQQRTDALRNAVRGIDSVPDWDAPRDANTATNIASGLDGAVRMSQGQSLEPGLAEADRIIDPSFRGGSWPELRQARGWRDGIADQAAGIDRAGRTASGLSAVTAGASAVDWWGGRTMEEARVLLEQAAEGHEFLAGRLDQDVRTAEARIDGLQQRAAAASARRSALSAEIDMRAARAGHLLWPQ